MDCAIPPSSRRAEWSRHLKSQTVTTGSRFEYPSIAMSLERLSLARQGVTSIQCLFGRCGEVFSMGRAHVNVGAGERTPWRVCKFFTGNGFILQLQDPSFAQINLVKVRLEPPQSGIEDAHVNHPTHRRQTSEAAFRWRPTFEAKTCDCQQRVQPARDDRSLPNDLCAIS